MCGSANLVVIHELHASTAALMEVNKPSGATRFFRFASVLVQWKLDHTMRRITRRLVTVIGADVCANANRLNT